LATYGKEEKEWMHIDRILHPEIWAYYSNGLWALEVDCYDVHPHIRIQPYAMLSSIKSYDAGIY
jgi:hypothetical protein